MKEANRTRVGVADQGISDRDYILKSRFVAYSEISNNVGSVKHFLSVLPHSLQRVVFFVPFLTAASTTTARS